MKISTLRCEFGRDRFHVADILYMHYGAPQEIFTDGGKNLWGGAVQKYLEKIKTLHKGTSPYHPQTNGKLNV